jgi:hypothetical protein
VPFTTFQYNGYIEVSKQGYSKGSLGPFITVQYIVSLEVSKQGYSNWGLGSSKAVHCNASIESNIITQYSPQSKARVRGVWGPV